MRDSVAKTKLAMIFTESLDVRDAFLDTPWPTDVSWMGGMERSRIWHENIHLRRQMQYDKEFQKPFADPWIEGVEDEKADLKIVPLTCPKDLFQDGQAMKHCVATYASRVRGNSCYIYSLRDMKDNRIATIEICRSQLSDVLYIDQFVVNNNVKYFVSQIRGHCNQNLDSKYRAFVEKWIADAKASKAA